ncbi:MAG: hypothetical protein AAF196_17505 [Planctomycetota bacterium]
MLRLSFALCSVLLAAWTVVPVLSGDKIPVAVFVSDAPGSAARLDAVRERLDAERFELVEARLESVDEAKSVVSGLIERGVVLAAAPCDPTLREAVAKAAKKKVVLLGHGIDRTGWPASLGNEFAERYRVATFAIAHDGDRSTKDLIDEFEEDEAFEVPSRYLLDVPLTVKPAKAKKAFEAGWPDVVLIDGEPEEVLEFLSGAGKDWSPRPLTLFTQRSLDRAVLAAAPPGSFAILGRTDSRSPEVPYGRAEGRELAAAFAALCDSVEEVEAKTLRAGLKNLVLNESRGELGWDKKAEMFRAPTSLFAIREGVVETIPPQASAAGPTTGAEETEERTPDSQFGVPFGTLKLRDFEFEEGTHWVHCTWGGQDKRTIEDDLRRIGLSTDGADPVVDRIVLDELMARVLSITSLKFHRNEDGTSIAGESAGLSFGYYRPETETRKRRLWRATFAGDDDAAGGRAFGTYCEIYSTFIRRTIFDQHPLTPAIGPSDLKYLDGSYRFGSDAYEDKRSEEIRALINAYGGSMALTTAHEVGHLCGLGHTTANPRALMNVEEGAGLDHNEAFFIPEHWERITERYGVVGQTR